MWHRRLQLHKVVTTCANISNSLTLRESGLAARDNLPCAQFEVESEVPHASIVAYAMVERAGPAPYARKIAVQQFDRPWLLAHHEGKSQYPGRALLPYPTGPQVLLVNLVETPLPKLPRPQPWTQLKRRGDEGDVWRSLAVCCFRRFCFSTNPATAQCGPSAWTPRTRRSYDYQPRYWSYRRCRRDEWSQNRLHCCVDTVLVDACAATG